LRRRYDLEGRRGGVEEFKIKEAVEDWNEEVSTPQRGGADKLTSTQSTRQGQESQNSTTSAFVAGRGGKGDRWSGIPEITGEVERVEWERTWDILFQKEVTERLELPVAETVLIQGGEPKR